MSPSGPGSTPPCQRLSSNQSWTTSCQWAALSGPLLGKLSRKISWLKDPKKNPRLCWSPSRRPRCTCQRKSETILIFTRRFITQRTLELCLEAKKMRWCRTGLTFQLDTTAEPHLLSFLELLFIDQKVEISLDSFDHSRQSFKVRESQKMARQLTVLAAWWTLSLKRRSLLEKATISAIQSTSTKLATISSEWFSWMTGPRETFKSGSMFHLDHFSERTLEQQSGAD